MKASSKTHSIVEQNKEFTAVAWWFAECVAEFYKRGAKHDEFRFAIDDMEMRQNPDGTITYLVGEPHTNIDGHVLNVIPQEALDEWDGYEYWSSWRYRFALEVTSEGVSGDIVIHSGCCDSFSFVATNGRVQLIRVLFSCGCEGNCDEVSTVFV